MTLLILQFAAFIAVGRVEDIALRRLERAEQLRIRVVGIGVSALGLFAGWPIPNISGSGDLALVASAVLSITALVVVGQAVAAVAFIFARWFTRQYVGARRGHKT